MSREMLITVVEGEECRVAVVENGALEELYLERASVERHVGNIYKGRVNNVEPTIQAAFVDIGMPKNGFLHASDVLPSACPRRKKQAEGAEGGEEKKPHGRHPLIQEIFRPGDEVVVQITKEGIGTKGPSLTTALSIPGRYLVLMPGLGRLGVSRKIEDELARRELRELLGSLQPPPDMGFIVRTAGMGRGKRELQQDLNYLVRLWKVVQDKVQSSKAPAEIFRESDLVMRTLRDTFTPDIAAVWIDSESVLKRAHEFMKIAMPRHVSVARLYTDRVPLFHKYRVEEAIDQIYSRTVTLPKGGSIVIDQTEAMVTIDVNSGRFRHGRDAEESAHQLNVMAAKEIARQIRLRDLGGLILLDFVDMDKAENRRHVERTLRDEFKNDRARHQMLHISKFGIVEMTRQRVQPSLERSTYMDCPCCKGTGILKHPESLGLEVMRHLKLLVSRDAVASIEVTVHPQIADHVTNAKRQAIARMEAETHKRIRIKADPAAGLDQIAYHCTDDRGAEVRTDHLPPPQPPRHEPSPRGRQRPAEAELPTPEETGGEAPPAPAASEQEGPGQPATVPPEGRPKGRGRRRRGGRRHRKHPPETPSSAPTSPPPAQQESAPQDGQDSAEVAPLPEELGGETPPPAPRQEGAGQPAAGQQGRPKGRGRRHRGGRRHRKRPHGTPPATPPAASAEPPHPDTPGE